MRVSDFEFELPEHLIAQHPAPDRVSSRLLHLDATTGALQHHIFSDIIDLLEPADLLVFNNTRVIPARLFGAKQTGGKVELLLERVLDNDRALVQVRSSKSPRAGGLIKLDGTDVTLTVEGREDSFFLLRFPNPGVIPILKRHGHIPLPPYIQRADDEVDEARYQTVYAEREGAVAAPTAGLHFDEPLLGAIAAKGVTMAHLTLHVGAGTFQPVRVENIDEHQMHREWLELDQAVVDAVAACRERGGRVVAVGTTSVRSLETAAAGGELKPYQGDTDIFIYPGYEFRCVDAMITNFHLPGSTLMMLVSAFSGIEPVQDLYREAIAESYRFFSYGDACLLTR